MEQVTTTASSTRSSPRRSDPTCAARLLRSVFLWLVVFTAGLSPVLAQPAGGDSQTELQAPAPVIDVPAEGLQLRSTGEVLQLSAALRFELPTLVEDALHKGIPVHFVQEARLVSERWYWSDKVVAQTERHMRLSFQPLTRRWRLYTSASPLTERAQAGVSLGVTFDSLEDALAAMQRITRWTVADLSHLPSSGELMLEFQMRIDTAQLPRPLQIGNLGRTGWSVLASRTQRLEARELR